MKLGSVLWAFAILLAISVTNAANETPLKIDVNELIQHPSKYNGRRVDVKAYVVTSCTHCGDFYASIHAARRGRANAVAVGDLASDLVMPKWPTNRLSKRGVVNDGFVHVVGKFEWKRLWRKEYPVKASSWPERSIVVANGGFGWMGLRDKQITEIDVYEPIGPEIPSGID